MNILDNKKTYAVLFKGTAYLVRSKSKKGSLDAFKEFFSAISVKITLKDIYLYELELRFLNVKIFKINKNISCIYRKFSVNCICN